MNDCIIIGGGPAGLTAALYLARFLRKVTVFDAQDGRTAMIPKTHNLAPFPEGISGSDLLDRMRSHAVQYGAVLEHGVVSDVARQGDLFHVTTAAGVKTARTIILATGVFNHRPPLSAADHDAGLGRGLIRYCPVCDAFEIRNKRVAVLGSGKHGFAEAKFIHQYSQTVTLIPPDGSVAIAQGGIMALPAAMTAISLTEAEVVVTLETGAIHAFDTLYVALGTTPRSALAATLGLEISKEGCLIVDKKQRTSVSGVYAIGDVTDGLDQIAVAMGQAAVAATTIHNGLKRYAS